MGGCSIAINKKAVFCSLFGKSLPSDKVPIRKLIDQLDAEAKRCYGVVSQGALNNCHGDWYEWLIAITAWNVFVGARCRLVSLKLPNNLRFSLKTLYLPALQVMINDLEREVLHESGVTLFSSNPDFVVVEKADVRALHLPRPIAQVTTTVLEDIDDAYKCLVGKCSYSDIEAYIGLKLSTRSDRRLQLPHEGSLVKALYVHLQTRQWIKNPKGIKYYAMCAKITKADEKALKTVATHSITTVASKAQAAVDQVFPAATLAETAMAFRQIQL